MLHRLRRHAVPVSAHFRHSLVLAYACPAAALEPLLPSRLMLDRHGDNGLAAAAFVQTEKLRPSFLPRLLGTSFFLAGYRLFVRVRDSPSLRGLYVLRSDTDRRTMELLGNALTHYRYTLAEARITEEPGRLAVEVRTLRGEADVDVVADLDAEAALPTGSPFETLEEARGFAGPLPYTFDVERETGAIVAVRGQRSGWEPQPVSVDVRRVAFFEREPFADAVLANAFHVADVDYRWERGRLL
ncbi:MAG TPA: DUF2071 domain-containing protein [Gaiellaceae bacterium]|nr:DUF2071 domain-containing protein [Gaiellaceae bacterium]